MTRMSLPSQEMINQISYILGGFPHFETTSTEACKHQEELCGTTCPTIAGCGSVQGRVQRMIL